MEMTATFATELRYTAHAEIRLMERNLPKLTALPETARLADRDSGGDIYKVLDDEGGYFLIVGSDRVVVTAFRKADAEWKRWRKMKERRRHKEARLEIGYFRMGQPVPGSTVASVRHQLRSTRNGIEPGCCSVVPRR